MKLTRVQKDTLVALLKGKEPCCGWETFGALAAAGFIDEERELTSAGRDAARAEAELQDRARRRRNARARDRNAVYSSLGMRRTACGWE